MSPSASDHLLFDGAQAPFDGWSVVRVTGAHRVRFLHSQLTSDIERLQIGGSQPTTLLDRVGRIQVFGFLLRRETWIDLLLPTAAVDGAVEYLESHVIADDVRFENLYPKHMWLALGPEAVRRYGGLDEDTVFPVELFASRGFIYWGGDDIELAEIDATELEARRVLSGLPKWGLEAGRGTPVYETTLIRNAVSFEKGCYLGQETVAKIASGRGAAKAPVLLEISESEIILRDLVGSVFSAEERDRAGEVLSWSCWEGRFYLQASVAREFRVAGREILIRFKDGTELGATVHNLPFLLPPEPREWAHRLTLRAVEEFSADREDEAIVHLERAIAVCPQYADAYESLGVIFGRQGRYEEAIGFMLQLADVDPMSIMAHTNLSLYYNQLGRIEDAEREAGEAMRVGMARKKQKQDIESSEVSDHQAALADRKRRAEMFRQVLELDPNDALGNFGLGELLVEEGSFSEAVLHLERALDADPRYSAAFLALGRAHEGCGDTTAAAETYRRGVEVAAGRGDLSTANKMQERLAELRTDSS